MQTCWAMEQALPETAAISDLQPPPYRTVSAFYAAAHHQTNGEVVPLLTEC